MWKLREDQERLLVGRPGDPGWLKAVSSAVYHHIEDGIVWLVHDIDSEFVYLGLEGFAADLPAARVIEQWGLCRRVGAERRYWLCEAAHSPDGQPGKEEPRRGIGSHS